MKGIPTLLAAGLALATMSAPSARAQDVPKVDLFAGYTYIHGNVVVSGQGISLNGGSASVAYNWNDWLGLAADFGSYVQGSVAGQGKTLNVTTYLFGPRLSWRKLDRFTPFGQVLLGGGHAGGTLYTSGANPLGTQNSFAMTAGGGVDWNANRRVAVRLIQSEYLRTQLHNGVNTNQNSLRLLFGVVFHFRK